jgi:hypothetical protein
MDMERMVIIALDMLVIMYDINLYGYDAFQYDIIFSLFEVAQKNFGKA